MAILVLRRRRRRTPAERALGLTSTALRLLPAVRTARTTYKVVRRVPVVAGGAVVAVVVVRRVRSSGDGAGPSPAGGPTPGASTPTPTPSPATAAPAAGVAAAGVDPAGTPGTGAPGPAGEAAGTGTPPHGDPLGAAATGDLGAGDPTSTRHGADVSTGTDDVEETLPGVGPEPGPGGTSEIESGMGAIDLTTPAVDTIHVDEVTGSQDASSPPAEGLVDVTTPGLPTVIDDEVGGGMVGAPDDAAIDADAALGTGTVDELGGGMVGAPDLQLPATPEGADAANDALLDELPPNESAPGHHPDETDPR